MGFLAFICVVAAICFFLKIYSKVTMGRYSGRPDMKGKTVLITGCTAGIGMETAKRLAALGARIVMACRNLKKAQRVAERLQRLTRNQNIACYECDVSLMKSVRRFTKEFLEKEERLDVLVLNAGMAPSPGRTVTEEGLEQLFATNHLGHFLLTNLLLDTLKKSAPSRVVVVSSVAHHFANIDFENLNLENHVPPPNVVYSSSKLANVLFMKELSGRLKGTGVTVNAVHPGLVWTDIAQNMSSTWQTFWRFCAYLTARTVEESADTVVQLAAAKELQSVTGKYFQDCKEHRTWRHANDIKLARKLWEVSEKLCGLSVFDSDIENNNEGFVRL